MHKDLRRKIGACTRAWIVVATLGGISGVAELARGQEDPPVPAPSLPSADESAPPREAELEERLRQMEEANRQLTAQMQQMMEEVRRLRTEMSAPRPVVASPATSGGSTSSGSGSGSAEKSRDPATPNYNISNTRDRGSKKVPLKATFGPGFEWMSEDEEFQLQFHQETQLDYRAFDPNGEEFARDGFVFPRVRAFFTGRLTKPVEYMFSFNRGFGNLDILDAWVNLRYDDRLQVKAGRFMTPFNYEQFAIQNMWLIAPERSLFTSNLGLNRQLGLMAWGFLADERMDYALGVFDGPRNSYEDTNDAKDVFSYVNFRPFKEEEQGSLLRDLNFGGSFTYGSQDNALVPRSLRVAANASNAGTADRYAPPFLIFNDGVIERGVRSFWSGHVAYFYRHLSVVADYNGGILRYARNNRTVDSTVIPTAGYAIAAGYFLTGETVQRRTVVDPLKPFDLRRGKFGLGAVELIARFTALEVDDDVFSEGLANRDRWSNRAWVTNLGVNWYLNRYLKMYIDWQHAEFGDPVFYAPPDRKSMSNNMFWWRLQLYF